MASPCGSCAAKALSSLDGPRENAQQWLPRAAGIVIIPVAALEQHPCMQVDEQPQQGPAVLSIREPTWAAVARALCTALTSPDGHSPCVTLVLTDTTASEQTADSQAAALRQAGA